MKTNVADASLQFVFAWVIHPVLGNVIEAYALNRLPSGHFSYEYYRVTAVTLDDYFPGATDAQRQILGLTDKYSEEILQKKFRPGKQKSRTFYENLEADFVEDHIRPYIDKYLYQIVGLLFDHQIPLYFKGAKNERIQEQELLVMPDMAEALFIFDRQEQETHYSLQMLYQGEQVALNDVDALLMAKMPCLLNIGNKIFRFLPEWNGRKLAPFFNKEYIVIPKSSEKKYFQTFVLNALKKYPVKAIGFIIQEVHQPPVPWLSIEPNWKGHWVIQLYFYYPHKVKFHAYDSSASSRTLFHEQAGQYIFSKVWRSKVEEQNAISFLGSLGLTDTASDGFYLEVPANEAAEKDAAESTHQLWELVEWLGNHKDILEEEQVVIDQQTGKETFHIGIPDLIVDVSEQTDWFDLKATVCFGEHRIPFLRLKNVILQGKREFLLPDGTIGLIPQQWIEKFTEVFRFATAKGDTISLKKHHFPLLEQISDQGMQVPDLSTALERFVPPELPASLRAELRPYQVQGYRWLCFLHEHNLGGCLADDMGLGKTLQTLALLARVHQQEQEEESPFLIASHPDEPHALQPPYQLDMFVPQDSGGPRKPKALTLIVMPLSLIHNWIQEIRRFAPSLKVLQHTGSARASNLAAFAGYDLVLTTYGTVRSDVQMLSQILFKYVILDESQVIKNAESKIFHAIKALKAGHRLVLTGTPIENSLADLWSQFSFLNPGMLGSLSFFRSEYVQPVEKNQDEAKRSKLKKLIEPFILRRTKPQVAADLPTLTQMTRYCEMTPEHRDVYEARKSKVRNLLLEQLAREGMDKTRFFILSSLMKLRMLANHPAITEEDYPFDSGKFQVVRNNLEKLLAEGHKVLIFSQFVKHLNIYGEYFERQGLSYSLLTGKVPEKERQVLIREFQQDPARQLFLISLRAGGVGLNLTGADYVFILDPWWNPAVELQAINRAHRIGQDKKVFVYKFITRETVEEKILLLQQKKSDLAGSFVHASNPLKLLDAAELKELMD